MPETQDTARPEGLTVPELRHETFDLDAAEIRTEGDSIQFTGHAAVFDRLSADLGGFRERIKRGAFRKALDADQDVRFLVNHDANLLLARTKSGTMELREDPKGLRVYAELAPTSYAQDLRVLVKRGDLSQMSFGFTVESDTWTDKDGEVTRTINSFDRLVDVSVVTFPAYSQTDASVRSLSVAGVDLYDPDSGEVRLDALRALAWSIQNGEVEASRDERALIDAAFANTPTVSPWTAQRALRAIEDEPELRGADQDSRSDEDEDQGQGEGTSSLAARRRRLTLIGHGLRG